MAGDCCAGHPHAAKPLPAWSFDLNINCFTISLETTGNIMLAIAFQNKRVGLLEGLLDHLVVNLGVYPLAVFIQPFYGNYFTHFVFLI